MISRGQIEDARQTLRSEENKYDSLETDFIQDDWILRHRVQEVSSSSIPPSSLRLDPRELTCMSATVFAISRWLAALNHLNSLILHSDSLQYSHEAAAEEFALQSLSSEGITSATIMQLEQLEDSRSQCETGLQRARLDASYWKPLVLDDTEALFNLHQFCDQDESHTLAFEFPGFRPVMDDIFIKKLQWDQDLYGNMKDLEHLHEHDHSQSQQPNTSVRIDELMNNWFWGCLVVSFWSIRDLTYQFSERSIPVVTSTPCFFSPF